MYRAFLYNRLKEDTKRKDRRYGIHFNHGRQSKKKSGSGAPQRFPLIQRFPASFFHSNVVQLATAKEQAIINQHGLTLERGIYYKGIPVHENRPIFVTITDQEYFYRSMTMEEAISWLDADGKINPSSAQPWASFFGYSKTYITNSSDYSIMLEIHAPGFLTSLKTIGFTNGKGEGGDISWGIGGQVAGNSNGFSNDGKYKNDFSKEWDSASKEYAIDKSRSILNDKVGKNTLAHGERTFESYRRGYFFDTPEFTRLNAVALAPYLFKRAIQSVKVVYLRTTP